MPPIALAQSMNLLPDTEPSGASPLPHLTWFVLLSDQSIARPSRGRAGLPFVRRHGLPVNVDSSSPTTCARRLGQGLVATPGGAVT